MSLLFNLFRDVFKRATPAAEELYAQPGPDRIFIGTDPRQALASNVLAHSLNENARSPLLVTMLDAAQLPLSRTEPAPLTFGRFLVPWLCGYRGWALFLESDMLLRADIGELFAHRDEQFAVMMTKSCEPAEWPSALLFNCSHPAIRTLTPDFLDDEEALASTELLYWLDEAVIGELPLEWNHTVGYDLPRDDAKLVHFPLGVPIHCETDECEYADDWHDTRRAINASHTWVEMFGRSPQAMALRGGRIVPMAANDPASSIGRMLTPARARSNVAPPPVAYSLAGQRLLAEYGDFFNHGLGGSVSPTFAAPTLHGYVATIGQLCARTATQDVLDYGCGAAPLHQDGHVADGATEAEALTTAWRVRRLICFDPAIAKYNAWPQETFDGVVCAQVLEYCARDDVDAVLTSVFAFAKKFVFLGISCQVVANDEGAQALPVLERSPHWWRGRIERARRVNPHVMFVAMCTLRDGQSVLIEG